MKHRVFPQKKIAQQTMSSKVFSTIPFFRCNLRTSLLSRCSEAPYFISGQTQAEMAATLVGFFWRGARQKFFDVRPIDQRMILIRFDQSFVMEGQPICQAELVFFHAISLRSAR